MKNADQEKVARLVREYIVKLSDGLLVGKDAVHKDFKKSYDSLKKQTPNIPSLDSLLTTIRTNMASREILILNKNTTGDELNYSRYFNFLIGGNTLGRGLAIKNLLVTYYVREAKTTQMDTMYQHARMFGYRKSTLPYTRVFLPPQLYDRFRQIFISDENLRAFINENKGAFDTLPVRIAANIRATRSCVLDARKVEVLVPGKQILSKLPIFQRSAGGTDRRQATQETRRIIPSVRFRRPQGHKDQHGSGATAGFIGKNMRNKCLDRQEGAHNTFLPRPTIQERRHPEIQTGESQSRRRQWPA